MTTLPFADQLDHLPESPDWLAELRQKAAKRFRKTGLPTTRDERWKYTDLKLLDTRGELQSADPVIPPPLISGIPRAIFVDGIYREDLSNEGSWSKHVGIWSMASDLIADTNKNWIGKFDLDKQAVGALNTALFKDGLRVMVGSNVKLDTPLEICFVGTGSVTSHARLEITLNDNSSATIIERHVGSGEFVTTVASEISISQGASFRHYRLQSCDPKAIVLATAGVEIEQDAIYDAFSLTSGARLSRHEIEVILVEGNSEVRLNGAHVLSGNAHADTTTEIRHMTPNCRSRETYRHVMDGTSRSVFQGKIFVAQDAQKTDGFQLNQSLMLSPTAEVNAKPELEIYADDVKCSHGATSGRLDTDALFYLRSRGIPETEARQMLIEAFIGSSIDLIENEAVRDAFRAHATSVLGGDK